MSRAQHMRSLSVVVVLSLLLAVVVVGVTPASAAAATSQAIQLTNNALYDSWPDIDGDMIVWRGSDGSDYEIFLMNVTTGAVLQLSNNTYDDQSPRIDAGQVAWRGYDGNDWEIFLYNGTATNQLTHNTYHDYEPHIDGGQVAWEGRPDGAHGDIFLYDGSGIVNLSQRWGFSGADVHETTPDIDDGWVTWELNIYTYYGTEYYVILDDASNDTLDWYWSNSNRNLDRPLVDAGQVTWHAYDGSYYRVWLYDGTSAYALSQAGYSSYWPTIDGGQVAWHGHPGGGDGEIYLYDGESTAQLTDNDYQDYYAEIDGGRVAWHGYVGGADREVFLYDGGSTTQLTDNDRDDHGQRIHGGHVVWHHHDGNDWEVFVSSQPPQQPGNSSPVAGAYTVLGPTLLSNATFADPEGDSHAASQWQVRTAQGDYSSPVWESVSSASLTSVAVPDGVLTGGTTYYWRVRYRDNFGAWSSYSDETFFVTDGSPPVPAITALTPDPISDDTPTFSGTVTDAYTAIAWVQYRVGGGSWTAATFTADPADARTGSYTFTMSALDDGDHTVEVRASDMAGNVATSYASDSFTVDTAEPVATAGDQIGNLGSRMPLVSGSITDATGTIVLVEYRVDGGAWQRAPFEVDPEDSSKWDYDFNTFLLPGDHTIEVRATDDAGNVITTNFASFILPVNAGLGAGAIAGITIGILLVVGGAGAATYVFVIRPRRAAGRIGPDSLLG